MSGVGVAVDKDCLLAVLLVIPISLARVVVSLGEEEGLVFLACRVALRVAVACFSCAILSVSNSQSPKIAA